MEKITNVQALTFVLENCALDEEVAAKIAHMRDQFAKKSENKGERKPSALQLENAKLREQIVELMMPDTMYSSAELAQALGMAESGNRVAALMPALVTAGTVVKVVEKRKNFYKLA